FDCSRAHRDLHSFPTRRSSDLNSPIICSSRRSAFSISPAWIARWTFSRRTSSGGILGGGGTTIVGRLARGLPFAGTAPGLGGTRSEEHTSELQSLRQLVCRLLL